MSDPIQVILTNDEDLLRDLLKLVIETQIKLAALTEIMRAEDEGVEEDECRGLLQ